MIKLLLKIPFLRSRIVKEVFKITAPDAEEAPKLEYKFSDSQGQKYYKYIADGTMPLVRCNELQTRLLEMESRISRESLLNFSKALKRYAENKDFLKVAMLVGELEKRIDILYDPEATMRMLCGLYIREDQMKTAHLWNPALEEEKFQQIMADNQNGNLSFFFQMSSISDHFEFLNTSDTESQALWSEPVIQNLLKQTRRFDQMILETLNLTSKRGL